MTTPGTARNMLLVGCVLMGLTVALGAVGSHALESYFADSAAENVEKRLANWQTAVRYQAFHGLALLVLGNVCRYHCDRLMQIGLALFVIGTILFSGMLYCWVLTQNSIFVKIVPIGGMSLIAGWLFTFISLTRMK